MSAQSEVGGIPWWRLATAVLLAVALGIAVRAGRTIETFIIGALMLPTLVLLGAWLYIRARPRR